MKKLAKITKQIDEERSKAAVLIENKTQYIKLFENRLNERFEKERYTRKELEKRYTNLVEDRFNTLKIEISKESRTRYESIENLKSYLEVFIINLRMIFLNYKD